MKLHFRNNVLDIKITLYLVTREERKGIKSICYKLTNLQVKPVPQSA